MIQKIREHRLLALYLVGFIVVLLIILPPAVPVSYETVYRIETDKTVYRVGEKINCTVAMINPYPFPVRIQSYLSFEVKGYYKGEESQAKASVAMVSPANDYIVIPANAVRYPEPSDTRTMHFKTTKEGAFIIELNIKSPTTDWSKTITVQVEA